jgi:hypothetical protein
MIYKIYYKYKKPQTVLATNYNIDNKFVNFYTICLSEHITVASFSTKGLVSITSEVSQSQEELRVKKLQRILKEDNIFKKLYKKYVLHRSRKSI